MTVVGVVVLLIAAIAFANRGDGNAKAPGAGPDSAAAPTAATGSRSGRASAAPTATSVTTMKISTGRAA